MSKEKVIRFRVSSRDQQLFYRWCSWTDTTPSAELRKFVNFWAEHMVLQGFPDPDTKE